VVILDETGAGAQRSVSDYVRAHLTLTST